MAMSLELHKIKTPKGKISKIFHLCEKHGVSSLLNSNWKEIKEVCDSINGRFAKDTTKFKCLLTLANPLVSVEEKDKICSHLKFSVANTYRSDTSKELLHKFLTPAFIEYLCFKYPTNIESVINVTKLPPEDLSHLITNHASFAESLKKSRNEALLNTLFQSNMNIKDFLGESSFADFLNKKITKLLQNKQTKYEERILIKHEAYINKMLKNQYPQLELFHHIFLDKNKYISNVIIKILKDLEPMNLKDYLKKNYGVSSSKMIHFIKNNFNSLESNYHLIRTLNIYCSVIKDYNLIWHILDDIEAKEYPKLISEYFSENEFIKNKDLLTETQWALFFKTLNHYLKIEPHRTTEHIRDSFRMISDVAYHNKDINLFQVIKENYRFQEYNTPEKLHEVLIVLYNKATNKEYNLNLEQQYPNILDQHNYKLTESLCLYIPKVSTDLTLWGQKLRICVGSYSRNVANGETLVVGITENGAIKYCAEVNPTKISLVQLRGFRNDDAPKEVFTAFRTWMESFKPSIIAAQEYKLKYDLSIIQSQIPQIEAFLKQIDLSDDPESDLHPRIHGLMGLHLGRRERFTSNPNILNEVKEYFANLNTLTDPENFEIFKTQFSFVSDLKHHHAKILRMEEMMGQERRFFGGLINYIGPSLTYFIAEFNYDFKKIVNQKVLV